MRYATVGMHDVTRLVVTPTTIDVRESDSLDESVKMLKLTAFDGDEEILHITLYAGTGKLIPEIKVGLLEAL